MIFAHCVILIGVNTFKLTTTGTFANSKSIYDVTGKQYIINIILIVNMNLFLIKTYSNLYDSWNVGLIGNIITIEIIIGLSHHKLFCSFAHAQDKFFNSCIFNLNHSWLIEV